jgi:radical SAM superfamily enzyme YgiQ (UPF0313 family)
MQVILFNPPTSDGRRFIREGRCTQDEGIWGTLWPPLSLAMIAAVLERDGHRVAVRDFPAEGAGMADLVAWVQALDPAVAIWPVATAAIESDAGVAARLKDVLPHLRTVLFGTHVTVRAREVLDLFPAVDVLVRREPEGPIQALVEACAAGRSLDGVAGISFRNALGEIHETPDAPPIADLDSLPLPAWERLDLAPYRLPLRGETFLLVAPSRGCPYPCTFCTAHQYYGRSLRRHSVERVVSELRRAVERHGTRQFLFWSDTFTLDRAYVRALCQAIVEARLDIGWGCNSRTDTLDRETLDAMHEAGCWIISLGIESLDDAVLGRCGKGASRADAARAVALARAAGLAVAGHFILGLPGDTPASIATTTRGARHLGLDFAQFYAAVPYPGTALHREAVASGWLDGASLEDYRQDRGLLALPDLPPRRVDRLRRRAQLRFYARPVALYRVLRQLRPRGLFVLLRQMFGVRRPVRRPAGVKP